jgi:2-polyprenyl-3-methyl-5-hydroxy-6-metoxy-1,4-benzoquinol methylase
MDKQHMIEYFDKFAATRDSWRRKNSYYHNDLKNFLRFIVPVAASVLETGCATGDIAAELSTLNPHIKGIDLSPEMIKIAKQKYPQLDLTVDDVEALALTGQYDYILMSDVVGYLFDLQKTFRGLLKISHPQTKLVITTYNYLWEPILRVGEILKIKMPHPMQNWLSRADLEQFLYLSGWEIIKEGKRLLFPLNLPLLSPLFNRYLAKLPLLRDLCLVNYFIARPIPAKTLPVPEPTVSIVIPARNEQGNIETAIRRTPELGSHLEIIFVEGNSTDDTWGEIGRVKAKYPQKDIKILKQEGKGKGDAVRKGFDAATGDILMILDADLTVRPEDLPKFYEAIAKGDGEFINGSRLVYPMEDESMRILNVLGNKFFSLMFSWLLEQRIKDTLCGTKVLWRKDYERVKAGRKFFGDFDPFGDYDLLFGANKLNLKIIDLPIHYQARVYGTTNISRFRHGWLLLKMCFFAMKKIKFI